MAEHATRKGQGVNCWSPLRGLASGVGRRASGVGRRASGVGAAGWRDGVRVASGRVEPDFFAAD